MSEKLSLGEFLERDIEFIEKELESLKKKRVEMDATIAKLEKLLAINRSNLLVHKELNKNETSA